MKLSLIVVLSMMLIQLTGLAQDVHLTIKKTATPPTIDGNMEELWNSVDLYDEFNLIEGEPVDEFDCTPSFRVMWDETYLYYYVKVVDDYLNVDETPENLRNPGGGWGWADDCIELYLDGDNSKSAKWNEETDAAQLWWLPFTPGIYFYTAERFHMDTTNIVYQHRETSDGLGWELEVAIPLVDANIKAEAGTIFGFEVDVGDDDGEPFSWRPEPFGGRDIKWKWYYTEDKTEPQYFANAQLSDEFISAVSENESMIIEFELQQNYPNPFNPKTNIDYHLSKSCPITLKVYDINGSLVTTLADQVQTAGHHRIEWDAAAFPSGIYFYSLTAGETKITRRMTLMR